MKQEYLNKISNIKDLKINYENNFYDFKQKYNTLQNLLQVYNRVDEELSDNYCTINDVVSTYFPVKNGEIIQLNNINDIICDSNQVICEDMPHFYGATTYKKKIYETKILQYGSDTIHVTIYDITTTVNGESVVTMYVEIYKNKNQMSNSIRTYPIIPISDGYTLLDVYFNCYIKGDTIYINYVGIYDDGTYGNFFQSRLSSYGISGDIPSNENLIKNTNFNFNTGNILKSYFFDYTENRISFIFLEDSYYYFKSYYVENDNDIKKSTSLQLKDYDENILHFNTSTKSNHFIKNGNLYIVSNSAKYMMINEFQGIYKHTFSYDVYIVANNSYTLNILYNDVDIVFNNTNSTNLYFTIISKIYNKLYLVETNMSEYKIFDLIDGTKNSTQNNIINCNNITSSFNNFYLWYNSLDNTNYFIHQENNMINDISYILIKNITSNRMVKIINTKGSFSVNKNQIIISEDIESDNIIFGVSGGFCIVSRLFDFTNFNIVIKKNNDSSSFIPINRKINEDLDVYTLSSITRNNKIFENNNVKYNYLYYFKKNDIERLNYNGDLKLFDSTLTINDNSKI